MNQNGEDLAKGVLWCSNPKEILINVIPKSVKIGIVIHIDGAVFYIFIPLSNISLNPIVIL